MYMFSKSTYERSIKYVTAPNYTVLEKGYAATYNGYSVYHSGANGIRYVGYFSNGMLIKPGDNPGV